MSEKGVVSILTRELASRGTGFFVRPDLIMTCGHVVNRPSVKYVDADGNEYVSCRRCDGSVFQAAIMNTVPVDYYVNGKQESIVILKTEELSDTYFRFCKRQIEGAEVFSCGYPNGSTTQRYARGITVDVQDSFSLQLGNSNSITQGCSGAPVLLGYPELSPEPVVAGMVGMIFTDTRNYRLLGDSSAVAAEEIILKAGQSIETVPETLLVADRKEDNRFVYNYKNRIELIGRIQDLQDLEAFCQADKRQVWWAMVGEGGSGKSRLALEFAEKKQREGWDVYFISRNLKKYLPAILKADAYNTLMIVDYVLTAGNALAEFLKELSDVVDNRRHKVKVLILERLAQKDIIQSAIGTVSVTEPLKYKEYNAESGRNDYLEIVKLNDLELLRLMTRYAGISEDSKDAGLLLKTLRSVDPENERPLYAMFIADAYKDNPERLTGWKKKEALQYVCDKEEEIWFKTGRLDDNAKRKCFKLIICYYSQFLALR